MCGIGGIFFQNPTDSSVLTERAQEISRLLRHRGPDDTGHWIDGAAGVALAHRRLSIVDLSEQGRQPMVSQDGRFVIAYNGEIYNHAELRGDLDALNVNLRGHSDTEVALECIANFGFLNAIGRFNGMFAIALWSVEEQCLYLVRDRVGIKPLYFGKTRSAWLFASELKALSKMPERPTRICPDALGRYMRFGYVPDDACIFEEMRKVPPGAYVKISSGSEDVTPVTYWSLRAVIEGRPPPSENVSANAAADIIEDKLRAAVQRRMIADVPVGAFLSGGVDSSIVVALMAKIQGEPVRTFTIGFHEKEFDESTYARNISDQLGTNHTELVVRAADAMELIEELPTIYDEPFADASQLPTILVSRLAAQHVKVVLSGDGGDELFCGYTRYAKTARLWNTVGRLPLLFRTSCARIIRQLPRSGNVQHNFLRLAAVLSGRNSREVFRYAVLLMDDAAGIVRNDPGSVGRFEEAGSVSGICGLDEEMMYADFVNYLPGDILTKVDRASMSTGLEARVPLLDHEFVEAAWQLSPSVRGNSGEPKKLLKQVLYRHLDPQFFNRPKAGFGVPLAKWLRGPLRSWAERLLDTNSQSAAELLDFEKIDAAWNVFLNGKDNQAFVLWNVLMFLSWRETWCAD